jgi:hypothetical protein
MEFTYRLEIVNMVDGKITTEHFEDRGLALVEYDLAVQGFVGDTSLETDEAIHEGINRTAVVYYRPHAEAIQRVVTLREEAK